MGFLQVCRKFLNYSNDLVLFFSHAVTPFPMFSMFDVIGRQTIRVQPIDVAEDFDDVFGTVMANNRVE